jgi:hypothetical protein
MLIHKLRCIITNCVDDDDLESEARWEHWIVSAYRWSSFHIFLATVAYLVEML